MYTMCIRIDLYDVYVVKLNILFPQAPDPPFNLGALEQLPPPTCPPPRVATGSSMKRTRLLYSIYQKNGNTAITHCSSLNFDGIHRVIHPSKTMFLSF